MSQSFRKVLIQRAGNVFMRQLIELGVGAGGMSLLSVPDAESGGVQTTPVTVLDYDSERWLVAPYGVTRWVRNARAAGQVELRRGRQRERVALVEVGPEEGAPVLRAYVQKLPMVRSRVGVDLKAPVEEFAAAVPTHPVFRIAASE